MDLEKGVTLPQLNWWRQFIARQLNKLLGFSIAINGRNVVRELGFILSVGLIVIPIACFLYYFFEHKLFIISPMLVACTLCGIVCIKSLEVLRRTE